MTLINELNQKFKSQLSPIIDSDFKSIKTENFKAFETLGLPNTKLDAWKFTNPLPRLKDIDLTLKSPVSLKTLSEKVIDEKALIVFENGNFNKVMSKIPAGLNLKELVESDSELKLLKDNYKKLGVFERLNLSRFEKILYLETTKKIEIPLTVLHLASTSNGYNGPLILVKADENSSIDIVEKYSSNFNSDDSSYWTNGLTLIDLEKGSKVSHCKITNEGNAGLNTSTLLANLKESSTLNSFTLSLSKGMVRNELKIYLEGEHATANVDGLYSVSSEGHCDTNSTIEHLMPRTFSNQLFKGILSEKGRGVFTGRVLIHRDAQEVEANQLNKNLLLGDKAHADSRPELLVYADDVACAHGATVGQIGDEELFYLQSRGINESRAYELLYEGYAEDAFNRVESPLIKDFLKEELKQASK